MEALQELFTEDSVQHTLIIISLIVSIGLGLGAIPIFKVKLGIAGCLFSGLAFGHFGLTINPETLHFLREFGLVLFVYAVGTSVGPRFIESFRQNGVKLNIMAASIVILGGVVTVIISFVGDISIPVAIGLFSGATTNTPSLAASQEVLSGLGLSHDVLQQPGLGYAVAYPFGIIGIILTMLITKKLAKVNIADEERLYFNTQKDMEREYVNEDSHPQIIPIFIGIICGVILGSIHFAIPGISSPIKLGLSGGTIIASIVLSRIGTIGPLSWRLPKHANTVLKDFGIVLFLACVGLYSGDQFVNTLTNGDGLYWMACAMLITLIPLAIVATVARVMFKMNFLSMCGLLAGSMTDPPALAFANSFSRLNAVSTAYATVFPLVMLMRIVSTQLIILLFL